MSRTILVIGITLLSCILTGLAAWYARRSGMVDHPGERHSHAVVTPRGGGIGIILALLIASPLLIGNGEDAWGKCVLPGLLVLAILGWWDDHASLSARFRFFVQLAVSIYLVAYAINSGWIQGAGSILLTVLFLVWMTNLYNFMDGSNGMAGLQAVFCGAVLFCLFDSAGQHNLALASACVAASCAGFLPWNLGNARVFMGDVGSISLGFVFGALLVIGVGNQAFTLPVALMVMLVFITDSTLTLIRRILKRERWYNAHKQHLYQRLIAHGWTHGRVALFYQAINLALVMPGIVVAVYYPALAWLVAMILILAFTIGWYLLIKGNGALAQAG
jgi:UDP-N-acetylmuramyl pentapeptide phosphotransferase/UDP-N-acetylglucosamine-1-phosphate transferase